MLSATTRPTHRTRRPYASPARSVIAVAELRSSPVAADCILRVYDKRCVFGAGQYTHLVRGQHAPRLTGEDVRVPVFIVVKQPGLPHAQVITVALAHIRGTRRS